VNLPIDIFSDDDFINFDPKKIMKGFDNELDQKAFKERKRSMVFIIAHRTCTTEIFNNLADLFDYDRIRECQNTYASQDILATRNAVMLYKAFKNEKTREVYICRNSFNAIQGKYPFMCKFGGSSLYLNPKKSKGYPSEIIDRRLYLGDATHAGNETIMHNLGITHILNVSNNIPNTFEDSKTLQITYQKINIEDSCDVPIELSFNLAYDFIDSVISKKKAPKMRFFSTRFDLVQNFSDARKKSMTLVSSAAQTNDILLDFNKMTVENVSCEVKDKMFDIDSISQYNMQNSNNQNRVLVHCAMGMSRSATMVIMYLMRKYQINYKLAFDIVKTRREIIDPNDGFMAKLKAYEGKQYKLKRTITLREGEVEIDEREELSDYSQASSTSSEDLMERRNSFEL
jgi:predicted protein tyrosine phosphatase